MYNHQSNRLNYLFTQAADNINLIQSYIDIYNADSSNKTIESGKFIILLNSLQHKYNDIMNIINNYIKKDDN